MNIVSLQTRFRKKLPYATQLFQALPHPRPFSSQKFRRTAHTKRLDKALRILDIIAPRTTTQTDHQNHLRVIQGFLQTHSKRTSEQRLSNGFISPNSDDGVSNVFDEILKASFLNDEEDSNTRSLSFDASVLSNAVSYCASTGDLRSGIQYHCVAISSGFIANAYVGSSLITFYGKCGDLENAYKVFQEMPVRNVVSWTAIISGFAQEWKVDMCLELYSLMRNSTLKPNDFTFISLLSACTGSGALGQGRSAHCQIIQMGFYSYLHIANALISMYCKSGNVEDALYIFENLGGKDIVSWNSMIGGYAQHGLAVQGIGLFERMKNQGLKPDAITYLGVLSSCRHSGFVEGGRNYFNSMLKYGVKPELDHYSCIVDLLGRAGLLDEARDFIERMPIAPNAVIWGSLLSSCRLHGSVWIGIQAAENRLLLEPGCAATHVQLANLYASMGFWDQAAQVRKLMKDRRLKTNAGCSWIEIKNEVYRFRTEDWSNTRVSEILDALDWLVDHMITSGCAPEMQEVSEDIH
ncbi:unnamed protein product [Dovyalis caffra]|uniref:Pentatricopeptide repeat-containing protein n=1 Tax=Dovyalis caffra TaxID=77055 RepID=A0AAV1RZT8_9ROSI|nr:unnamed protein product [Dovyalis caffra]